MAREAPAPVHQPKQPSAAERAVRGPPAQAARCLGATAQLAAVHRTLRHGPALQLRAEGSAAARDAAGPNRTGLPDRLKAGVEALSGVSLDGVKVHYNSSKPAQLNALAYAQGSDIHLAAGQERHLPHEAWHIVQQAQGRVKPTVQMRNGGGVNDAGALEREAQAMGGRASSMPLETGIPTTSSPSSCSRLVAQAYSIRREPTVGALYSVSDDKEMVTGMATPNHDLYVRDAGKIGAINDAANQSMLKFREGARLNLFDSEYTRVEAGFKQVKFETPGKFWGTEEHRADLDKQYHQAVAPAIDVQSQEKYKAAIDQVMGSSWEKRYQGIKRLIHDLMSALELFKKLVIANQTNEDFNEAINPMDAPQRIVAILEASLYSKSARRSQLETARVELQPQAETVHRTFGGDQNLLITLGELLDHLRDLSEIMPEDPPVDLMLVHSVNYQESMLISIEKRDPMFYRACDVMASTILGNKITEGNKDRLKIYAAGGKSSSFHFAAKILKSGDDWVSLESFAAGDRERDVLGITEENFAKNLDNSWQYLMYGSVRKRGKTGNEEDNAFELYTKLRYFLKGIKEPGEFLTTRRDRLSSPIPQDAFTTIPGIDAGRSAQIWQRLADNHVFGATGEVRNPDYLAVDYVKLRLREQDRLHAPAISQRLKAIYGTPRSAQRHITGTSSNEFRNILGWIKLTGVPVDVDKLELDLGDALMAGQDPLELHNMTWKAYMLAMEKGK